MRVEWKSCARLGLTALAVLLCVVYFQSGLGLLGSILSAAVPLVIGGVIAFVVNILMSFLERHFCPKRKNGVVAKLRRPLCMLLAYILIIAIIVAVVLIVVPEVMGAVQVLVTRLPGTLETLSRDEKVAALMPEVSAQLQAIDWDGVIDTVVTFVQENIGGVAGSALDTVMSVASSMVICLLGLVFSIYLLLGKERLQAQANAVMKRYLPEQWEKRLHHGAAVANQRFHSYIVGQCTEAVILGTLCGLGMALFQFPYALMIGVVVSFFALIPVAGAYISAVVGVLMIATVLPSKALLFIVFILVLQQIESNLIAPRVVGSSVGLPPLWVLAGVVLGGGLGGVVGMLLGVPVMATVYQLVKEDVQKGKPSRKDKITSGGMENV